MERDAEQGGGAVAVPERDGLVRRRGPTRPGLLELVERLATIPRRDGSGELRVEVQRPRNGPAIVALRVWEPENGTELPRRGRGFALRGHEIAPVLAALVRSLDWFREDERRQRLALGKRNADRRRAGRGEDGGPAAATGTEDHEPPPAA